MRNCSFLSPGRRLRLGLLSAGLAVTLVGIGCDQEPETREEAAAPEAAAKETDSPRSVPGPPPAGVLPRFVTVGAESGIDFERYDDISHFRRILEVNGGGVALLDFDADGQLDVFFPNGCRLPIARGGGERKCELFQNRSRLQFIRVTDQTGILQFGYTFGCAVGDYDADGFDDLYVTALGRNSLWQNNGDGTFVDTTVDSGAEAGGWSSSAAFADFNGDGHLDLYVVQYLDVDDTSPKLCENPSSPGGYESCPPSLFDGVDDFLLLSDGRGGFIDATREAGLSGLRGKGLGVVVSDLDDDGDPEIYVANDGEANFLLVASDDDKRKGTVFQPDGAPAIPVYENCALASGIALNESGYAQASMGVANGDYDGNGLPDLFLTHFYSDTNTLYANRGGLVFEDSTRKSRLGHGSRLLLGWGTVFFDADNDGWLDLFAANGHIEDRTWLDLDVPYRMPPLLYRNDRNGSFTDVSSWSGPYFRKHWLGRGAAAGDLDRDGKVDLAVSHQLAPSAILRNATETTFSAITLQLVGRQSNRSGYGTRVELPGNENRIVREVAGGGSFQSASAREIHLGLNGASAATIHIRWPSGLEETHEGLAPGRWVAIEGRGVNRLVDEQPHPRRTAQ